METKESKVHRAFKELLVKLDLKDRLDKQVQKEQEESLD